MQLISVKNFRRFKFLEPLKLGPITILVGGNNAGKSTLAKAIDLIAHNLTEQRLLTNDWGHINGTHSLQFDFSPIGNYGRVHRNNSNKPLEFIVGLGSSTAFPNFERFIISLTIEKANSEDLQAQVSKLAIFDVDYGLWFIIEGNSYTCQWVDCTKADYDEETLLQCAKIIASKANELRSINPNIDPEQYSYLYDELNSYQEYRAKRIMQLRQKFKQDATRSISYTPEIHINKEGLEGRFSITKLLYSFVNAACTNGSSKKGENSEIFSILKDGDVFTLLDSCARDLDSAISASQTLQLPIHTLEKSIVFVPSHPLYELIEKLNKIGEKEIYIYGERRGCSIHIKDTSTYRNYLISILNWFGVATDYRIKGLGGVTYIFELKDQNGKWVNLADYGTGTLRLIEILLFLILPGSKNLFIEEPEQNLHPKFQSLLADIFQKINCELDKKIIIETHSEYLVRRTQVIVYMNNYTEEDLASKNPFKVYYFPEDGSPYDMKYRIDGKFEEEFGSGFFDEASKLALQLF